MNQPITVVEKNTLQRLVGVPNALQCTLGLTLNHNSFILWVSEKSIFLVCKVAKNADQGIFWNIIN